MLLYCVKTIQFIYGRFLIIPQILNVFIQNLWKDSKCKCYKYFIIFITCVIHDLLIFVKVEENFCLLVESNGQKLLIGTENGNIYTLNLLSFEVTDSVVYLDVVMQKYVKSHWVI